MLPNKYEAGRVILARIIRPADWKLSLLVLPSIFLAACATPQPTAIIPTKNIPQNNEPPETSGLDITSTPALSEEACGARITVQDFDDQDYLLEWQELGDGYSHKFGELIYTFRIDSNHENYDIRVENPSESVIPADVRYTDRVIPRGVTTQFDVYDRDRILGSMFIAVCDDGNVLVSPTLQDRQYTPESTPSFEGSVRFDNNVVSVPINNLTRVDRSSSHTVFSVAPAAAV